MVKRNRFRKPPPDSDDTNIVDPTNQNEGDINSDDNDSPDTEEHSSPIERDQDKILDQMYLIIPGSLIILVLLVVIFIYYFC